MIKHRKVEGGKFFDRGNRKVTDRKEKGGEEGGKYLDCWERRRKISEKWEDNGVGKKLIYRGGRE